jgi:YegS/Rv2252/BmrU family lipid kinase
MPVVIIINPVAGGRRRSLPPGQRVELVERALERHHLTGRVELTRAAGHGRELARQAVSDGATLVVAWGGDGTINEVASQLVGTGTTLGIVRAGSGNGLARELGIPAKPGQAFEIALAGHERAIDVGEIDGHPFLNVAGIGFDAAMATEFNRLGGERRGPIRYALHVVRAAFAYPVSHYAIEADGRRLDVDALLVAIANSAQYGSNVVIAPGARPDDGLLDVVVIEGRGALGRIGLAPRLFDRTIHKAPGVTMLTAEHIVVRASSPIRFHVDGEPQVGGSVVEAHVRPDALRVKVA